MSSCCETKACQLAGVVPKKAAFTVALVGNPNCGKTTLFNALTGARQRVGNWPGVTVERKNGYFSENGATVKVVDLPGTYSLVMASDHTAIDERVACEFIFSKDIDLIINIVDASSLERNLYVTMQLLEMGVPVILALNMMDVALTRDIHVDVKKLSQLLGCPVLALSANVGNGVRQLKHAILTSDIASMREVRAKAALITYPPAIDAAIQQLAGDAGSAWLAMRLIENDAYVKSLVPQNVVDVAIKLQNDIKTTHHQEVDVILATTRYHFIQAILQQSTSRASTMKPTLTNRIDHIVLNRVLGIPIFLAVMYLLFVFSINIGGIFQDFFDIGSQTIFVDGFANLLTSIGAPTWLTALLANGAGKGINTTITFIPIIGAMFLFLALLEDSGYMARAAFVVDRAMRALGLPGKAFVPMIVGFGCNVPAVMSARTLENKRDRIITIMMTPFMSCGARLAIFAVFTSAFFPQGGQNVVFALYLIGIGMAVFTGFLLRKTLLKGEPASLIMELPAYHVPQLKTVCLHAWQRLKGFVYRAGQLIVPICILIGALNSFNLDGTISASEGDAHSLLSYIGQCMTFIFAPMGIHANNWPATVGLVTGILAKEVVVGTLNTLYTQMGHLAVVSDGSFHFWAGIKEAIHSIPANIIELKDAFTNPVLAKAPIHSVNQGVYGVMYKQFDGRIGAFAYLLFILLYFPCVSTTGAMLREIHRGWAIFSALWMTGVAYGTAVLFYQAATYFKHPVSSSIWIGAIIGVFLATVFVMRKIVLPTAIPPAKQLATQIS